MDKTTPKNNIFYSYVIRNYLFLVLIINMASSITTSVFIGLESMSQDGNTIPLALWMRNLLLFNSLSIVGLLVFLFIFLKKKTDHIEKNEEKVIFLEANKRTLKNKFYILLFVMLMPTIVIVLNTVLDSEETQNIACGVYEKELLQNKKSSPSYLIKVKCTNKSEYDLRVNTETWNKEKQGDTIIINTTKGGLGLERIKKISY